MDMLPHINTSPQFHAGDLVEFRDDGAQALILKRAFENSTERVVYSIQFEDDDAPDWYYGTQLNALNAVTE